MAKAKLSPAEMEVARVVWKLGDVTLGDVHQALLAERDVDYSTVQTYLRRLEAKGYLQTRRVGRTKLYRAKVSAGKVIRDTIRDLVRRLFDGEPASLVRHLLSEHPMSTADLKELRQMLADMKEPKHDSHRK